MTHIQAHPVRHDSADIPILIHVQNYHDTLVSQGFTVHYMDIRVDWLRGDPMYALCVNCTAITDNGGTAHD